MHKIIITTFNGFGAVAVTVLEFDTKPQAKGMYDALNKTENFPLNRTIELFLTEDMK